MSVEKQGFLSQEAEALMLPKCEERSKRNSAKHLVSCFIRTILL